MRLSIRLIVYACVFSSWCYTFAHESNGHEIVTLIRAGNYEKAASKFNESAGQQEEIMVTILENIFKDDFNFNSIISFASAIEDLGPCYLVLKALFDEVQKTSPNNLSRMIAIVQLIQTKIDSPFCDDEGNITGTALNFNNEVIQSIKRSATGRESEIKAALSDGEGDSDKLKNTVEMIEDLQLGISQEIMQKIIEDTYGYEDILQLLNYIGLHNNIETKIAGLEMIFENAKQVFQLNSEDSIFLAECLEALRHEDNYNNVNQEQRDKVEELSTWLSPCAKNLFFESSFCIWNHDKEEYLYAADSAYSFDSSRRSIFSGKETSPEAHWQALLVGKNLYFKNQKYENEYLYPAGITYKKGLRYLFNWIDGDTSNISEQDAWQMELEGDYCYLKSAYFNDEYLYATNIKHAKTEDMRYIFTKKPKASKGKEFLWQIRSC